MDRLYSNRIYLVMCIWSRWDTGIVPVFQFSLAWQIPAGILLGERAQILFSTSGPTTGGIEGRASSSRHVGGRGTREMRKIENQNNETTRRLH